MKKLLNHPLIRRSTDVLLSPLTLFGSIWHKYVRSGTATQMPVSEKIFMTVGVLPIRDQYYQPLINPGRYLRKPLNEPRMLPGIDWNVPEQLELLKKFSFQDELLAIPFSEAEASDLHFYYDNPSLCPADAEFLYNVIRHFKPRRVIEIGCGYSTRLSLQAERKNQAEDGRHTCTHICIEPYEMPWLEKLGVQVLRSKVEDLPLSTFEQLEAGDILFIDSSHIIRPQGDVLFEFLQILPTLKPGVIVHVHDIFSPRDYLKDWIMDQHCQWNEQYLLEAFLSFNAQFRIIGAVNLLKKDYSKELEEKCPITAGRKADEPGSFWIVRN
jgi:predicted O-methyltransferase YrrM